LAPFFIAIIEIYEGAPEIEISQKNQIALMNQRYNPNWSNACYISQTSHLKIPPK